MKRIILITVLAVTNVLAYHDPDLNYHLSQLQKLDGCDDRPGYSYRAPAVQLTTAGVKVAPSVVTQQVFAAPAYQYSHTGYNSNAASSGYASGSSSTGYSSGVSFQAVAPKLTYASQPAVQYEAVVSHANYAAPYANQVRSEQKEVHGYTTSAGLSAVASSGRTVTPQATYAQAPILAKITGAPLFAKFAIAPAKTTYVTQNLAAQQQASYATGSLAKASLNSYSSVQSGGPVVTQLYAAPAAAQYAASPALRVQQVQRQYITPARYTAITGPSTFYHQTGPISSLTPVANVASAYKGQVQYATSSVSQSSHQYSAPTVTQYAAPVAQYAAPAVNQYASPAVQYGAPSINQYRTQTITQHTAPAQVQYAAPAVTKHYTQYSAPVIQQYATPIKAAPLVSHYAAPAYSQYTSSASEGNYAAPAVSHVRGVGAPVINHASSAVTHITAPAVAHVAAPVAAIHARYHSGHGKNVHKEFVENYDAHPRYAYEYAVNDPHTGDIKQQKEERDGEVVKGQYSLVEPDGSVRTVNYVADWETGFHADVRNSKDNQH